MPASCPQDPEAFMPGRRREPARKGGCVAETSDVLNELYPDALADVVDIITTQSVADADGPDKRRVPLDELVPGLLVAASCPADQENHRRVVAHACPPRDGYSGAALPSRSGRRAF